MIPRKIQAPGIEVNEVDVSQYGSTLDLNENTVVLLNGFSDKGKDNTTTIVTSMEDFTKTYGYPTTEAERYLYNGVKQVLVGNGIPAVTKLPYHNRSLSSFSCCKYDLGDPIRLSTISDIPDINKLFPSFSGLDYNLSTIHEVVNNVRELVDLYSMEQPELNCLNDIINTIEEFDQQNGIDDYDLTSVSEIVDNLYELNSRFYSTRSLSGLDSSEQVRLFEEFINGICSFESYGLDQSVLSEIKSMLFGTIKCFINLRNILTKGTLDFTSLTSEAERAIFTAMSKNGYGNYDVFYEDFLAGITKDEFLQCIEDVKGTIISVDPDVEDQIRSLEYSDLANVDGMQTYVPIVSDPSFRSIDTTTYDNFLIGNRQIDSDSIFIVDISRGKYERDKLATNEDLSASECIGIVPVITTAPVAIWNQNIINHSSGDFRAFNIASSLLATSEVPQSHLGVNIASVSDANPTSLGTIATSYFPKIEYTTPKILDTTMFKKVGVVVFKMFIDPANKNKINFVPVESFVGSLDHRSKDLTTNASDFLENIVNTNSEFINLFVSIKPTSERKYQEASTFLLKNQPVFSLGFSSADCEKNISVELMKNSLKLAFEHLKNPNTLKIDVLADCGVSNIANYIANTSLTNIGKFEIAESYNFQLKNGNTVKEWKAVIDLYTEFCEFTRKDCMFIADSPRNFCLLGNQKIIRSSKPSATVENSIIPSLKYLSDFNTSYGAGYSIWVKGIDDTTRSFIWLPPTVKAIEAYLTTDTQFNFWDAPAGFKRGVLSETYDVAFNPSEKDAEKLYINRWNYAVSFPLDGIVLEGQKTFQKNKTAFDRVNVRRLFLGIEKDVARIAKTFLYDSISDYSLARFRDLVGTYLQDIKTKDGIKEFTVVCDSRNNTEQTIDNNELHCSIGIRPTKSLEFVVLNFICTNQSANVEEITSQNL